MGARTRAVSPRSVAPLLALAGGGAIAVGAWLPWMSLFAGLVPLRGVIGINGRLVFAAGLVSLVLVGVMALAANPTTRIVARRSSLLLGAGATAAAVWLLVGVRELTRVQGVNAMSGMNGMHSMNAMSVPRPGSGLIVVLVGAIVLTFASWRAPVS